MLPARVHRVVEAAASLIDAVPGVVTVGLVGSWARGCGHADSDVDLIVLTERPRLLLDADRQLAIFDEQAVIVRRSQFGAIEERRLRLTDGLVVEVGIGRRSWASTDPIDPGTRRVVEGGMIAIRDPADVVGRLLAAVARDRRGAPRVTGG